MTSTIDSIDLHLRSYHSALKSNLEVTINSLTNSFLKMEPIMNGTDAFIYSLLRLPSCIDQAEKVILGQNPQVFESAGFKNVTSWTRVFASARRRTCYFDTTTKTLAVFIASVSDLDDVVNLLIAYQLGWNQFHQAKSTDIDPNLQAALGPDFQKRLETIRQSSQNLRLRLLAGSWVDYTKNIQTWWKNIINTLEPQISLTTSPIYFTSSNSHSILNLFTGYIPQHQSQIIDFLQKNNPQLIEEWHRIQSGDSFLHPHDFLYFASQFLLKHTDCCQQYSQYQQDLGIINIPGNDYLDVNVQIFPISCLARRSLDGGADSRLVISKAPTLQSSNALIFNIDYPLGFTAYHVLKEILENIQQIKGVYILGKSAVLNSELGDIQIPRVVFDEHSQNTYMINNTFNSFFPFPNNQGSILTHQKAVSVLGTFLENEALLQKYSENNLTVVEMESGPYLSAISEATYAETAPKGTIVDLNPAPFDLGIINYTSDTPYSRARNLGAGQLLLPGAEPVYLGSLAILQRIINLEESQTHPTLP